MSDAGANHATPDTSAAGSTARASVTVAVWTLVSRLTGLLRIVVIGAVLGPTFFANSFLAANTVPNQVYTVIAGPILALVVVPALVRELAGHGARRSTELLGRVAGYLLKASALTAAALALASPLVAFAVTAGIPDEAARERGWQLTVLVLVFVAPQVVCYTVAALGAAAQQARGRFALAAAAPALENIGLMATMTAVALWYEPGVEVQQVPLGMVLVLGIGSTLSVAVHAATQLFGAHQAGLTITVRRGWQTDPAACEVTRRMRQSVVVAAFPSLSMFAMLAVAATVPGGVFVFQAAMSVYFVIAAIGAKAVTVAVLPGMSAAGKGDDPARFGTAWRQALSFSLTPSLPAMLLLVAFAEPVAATLANGELHDPVIVSVLAACLVVFALAQIPDAVTEVTKQAMFARLDVDGPRLVSTVMLAVRLAVALAALLLPAGLPRLVGLSCAVLLADVIAAILSLGMVRRRIRPQRLVDGRRLGVIGVASATMLPAAAAGSWLVREKVHDRLPQMIVGIGLGGVAVVCFAVVLAWLTGQLPSLVDKLRARLPG